MKKIFSLKLLSLLIITTMLTGCFNWFGWFGGNEESSSFSSVSSSVSSSVESTQSSSSETLSAPDNFTIVEGVASWSAVSGATSYVVVVDTTEYPTTSLSIDLTSIELSAGNHQVKVKALKNDLQSTYCAPLAYEVEVDTSQIVLSFLKEIDETYELEMGEDDFIEPTDYEDYQHALNVASIFATTAVDNNISEGDAIFLAGITFDYSSSLNDPLALKDLLGEYASLDISPEVIATLITEVTLAILEEIDNFNLYELVEEINLDKQGYINALTTVVSYIFEVNQLTDREVVLDIMELIDNGSLTEEEIFTLKDEILFILDGALPSATEFGYTFKFITLISKYLLNDPLPEDFDFADEYGTILYNSSKIYIELAFDVDIDMLHHILDLVEEAYIPAEYIYDEYGYYVDYIPASYNADVIVELILYVDEFIRNFKTEHQDLFTNLSEVDLSEAKFYFYDLIEEQLINFLYYQMSPEEADEIVEIVTDIFDNIEVYEELSSIYGNLTFDLYDYFIATEGAIALNIFHLDEFIDSPEYTGDPLELETFIKAIYYDVIEYYQIGVGNIYDFENPDEVLTTIVTAYAIPLKHLLTMELGFSEEEATIIIEDCIPTIVETIIDILTLQQDFISALEEVDVIDNIFINLETREEYVVQEQLIKALDLFLTSENIEKIDDIQVHILFDIISQHFSEVLDLTEDDIMHIDSEFIVELNTIYSDVNEIVTYDFTNLTEEQKDKIDYLLEDLFDLDALDEDEPLPIPF